MSPVSVKPKAVAFVDFEHWYISLDHMHIKPDYKGWYNDISSKYSVDEIYFFADFSNPSLAAEIPRIREITNFVIETQNSSPHHKKDYTDFIMLDHIYQRAMTESDIDTYIIFSGDGHFSSVVNFLCLKQNKNVGIYAVRDAVSKQLSSAASWTVEVPITDKNLERYYKIILHSLAKLEEDNKTKKKKSYAAFWPTVEAIVRKEGLNRDEVADALRNAIDEGYVIQDTVTLGKKSVKYLKIDKKKSKNLL